MGSHMRSYSRTSFLSALRYTTWRTYFWIFQLTFQYSIGSSSFLLTKSPPQWPVALIEQGCSHSITFVWSNKSQLFFLFLCAQDRVWHHRGRASGRAARGRSRRAPTVIRLISIPWFASVQTPSSLSWMLPEPHLPADLMDIYRQVRQP